jgi:glycosyltransferase involved in cell wall biosynthesis
MRILLVSQMYPGPDAPSLGTFVRQIELALAERGHEIERSVLATRAGGKRRHLELARQTRRIARAFRPDVVYAHFLVPTGLGAALAARDAPLVVTAHGQDVRNVGRTPFIRFATRFVIRRAAGVIAVSDWLRTELEAKIPEARGRTEVVDCGVDLERFDVRPAPDGPPRYLCIGALIDRKNVVRLAEAFARVADGTLTFVGDGPLRERLAGRPGVHLAGDVSHEEIPARIAAAHVVCQPSLVEPFGQATLEGMASGRSVVATRVGGPPEFVPPVAGALVDPLDIGSIADGLQRAAALPAPNTAARAAAAEHDVRRQAERIETVLERAVATRKPY